MDPNEGTQNVDPLVSLGLIDPKLIDAEPGSNPGATPAGDPADTGTAPAAQPKADPKVAELETKVAELEGRLTAASQQQGATLESDLARLDALSNQALAEAAQSAAVKEGKVDMAVVTALVKAEHGRLAAEIRQFHDRQALAPVAVQAAAAKMAKQMSTATVKITAEDLAGEATYEGMKARATTLLEVRRDSNYQARQTRGADRVEGGASPGTVDQKAIDALDPHQKIKLGLLRAR
jgi:hypothetical protein